MNGPCPTDTPENVARLRELRLTHSNEACGSALGISATTVRRWAAKHGIPACAEPSVLRGRNGREPWPDERVALLRELRAFGMPYEDIARHMGLSKSTVCGKAQRIGLAPLAVPLKRRPGVQIGRPVKVKPAPVVRAQRSPTGPTVHPWRMNTMAAAAANPEGANSTLAKAGRGKAAETGSGHGVPSVAAATKPPVVAAPRTYRHPPLGAWTFGCPCCARAILGPMIESMTTQQGKHGEQLR